MNRSLIGCAESGTVESFLKFGGGKMSKRINGVTFCFERYTKQSRRVAVVDHRL